MPIASLGLAVVGLILAVVAALVLPGKLFEYITTAAGILILFNWICILLSNMRIIKQHIGWNIVNVIGILLMLFAIAGILLEDTGRPGFYLSLFFVVAITIAAFIFERKKKESQAQ